MEANAVILGPDEDSPQSQDLKAWVTDRCDAWRTHRDQLYLQKWEEYNRIWRGIWAPEDRSRSSEKSRLISPATQQAVESTVSEMEEAVFGRGSWFDIRDDVSDQETADVAKMRLLLQEDLENSGVKSSISEVLLIAAIYGTGIGEIVLKEKEERIPRKAPIEGANAAMVGVETRLYTCIEVNPVMPNNFLIDPAARTIDSALGCAVEQIVSRHEVLNGIADGIYDDVEVGSYTDTNELDISEDQAFNNAQDEVKLLKWYGLVPKHLLEGTEQETANEEYVEAIIVIANDGVVLKATETPYMMKDRPVIAYAHDRIPGKFWGRGITEKGYNAQKALDAELRARMDGLALTTHPMMGLDATRLPRGAKFDIRPGATLLTNGPPKDVLFPFNFGNINPNTFRESAEFERMIQNATGAMDGATPTGINPRNNTASGMSMIMAASMKRQKRSLANFQESFLIPLINKAAWRFMQFDPNRYDINDWKFKPSSTMGIMAREYEQQQFVQLLSMTEPNGPVYKILLKAIINNSSFTNREELMKAIDEAGQPSPEQQKAQQAQLMLSIQKAKADLDLVTAQIKKIDGELQLDAEELKLKAVEISKPDPVQAVEEPDPMEHKFRAVELALEETKIKNDKEVKLLDLAIKAKQAEQPSAEAASQKQEGEQTKKMVTDVSKTVQDINNRLAELDKEKNTPVEAEILRDAKGKLLGVKKGNQVIKLKGNK